MKFTKRTFPKKSKWETAFNDELELFVVLDENLRICYTGSKKCCDEFVNNMIEEEELSVC